MTPQDLARLVDYDPETGFLIWKSRGNPRFDNWRAGRPAFSQKDRSGYFVGRLAQKNFKAHRVAWAIHYGHWPDGLIDHINGDRADNRIANLRVVNDSANAKNARLSSASTSGITGVTWFARDAKWWAKITVNGRVIHLGYFDKIEDAAAARRAAEREYGFHENHGH